MYPDYQELILTTYEIKKLVGELPANLESPSPANIKAECIRTFEERFELKDEKILRDFFPGKYEIKDVVRMMKKDTNNYRRVSIFLKNGKVKPKTKNIELAAWLLDIPCRPCGHTTADHKKHVEALTEAKKKLEGLQKNSSGHEEAFKNLQEERQALEEKRPKKNSETPQELVDEVSCISDLINGRFDSPQTNQIETVEDVIPIYNDEESSDSSVNAEAPEKLIHSFEEIQGKIRNKRKYVPLVWISSAAVGLLLFFSILHQSDLIRKDSSSLIPQCMKWTGEQYEVVSCGNGNPVANAEPYDSIKLKKLKKLGRIDTIGRASIPHLWYCKINGSLELFTSAGFHPQNTKLRLKPMTAYMYDRYIARQSAID